MCPAMLLGGCVDREYDLGKIEGDVSIGAQHPWKIPLATITISMDEFRNEASDIQSIFDEVDVWMSSTLPGNSDYVDIARLSDPDDPYTGELTDALFAEMDDPSSSKIDDVAAMLHNRYRDMFPDLPDDAQGFVDEFKTSFGEGGDVADALRAITRDICGNFLNHIEFETVNFSSDLGLDGDTIDMFAKNLDPEGTANTLNAAFLYGSVTSGLPVDFVVDAQFPNSGAAIPQFHIRPDTVTEIPETRFFMDDIESLAESFTIDVNFVPQRYYPRRGFDPGQSVSLKINLRKTGGLTF